MTIVKACEVLNISRSDICRSPSNYSPFYTRATETTPASFDMKEYIKREELKEALIGRTTLFVEYLKHEKGISYSEMSRLSGVDSVVIGQGKYSFKMAYKIASSLRDKLSSDFKNFHHYYNWKI